MMKEMWDERYSAEAYVYGKSPNDYFREQLERLSPGKLLMPGEGEGRNAVYAAKRGWEVDAFDFSRSGYEKAKALAAESGVRINYTVSGFEAYNYKPSYYDAIGLIFFHLAGHHRTIFHQLIIDSLKPGGTVILEGFHVSQLGKSSGGPQSLDFLFDEAKLLKDFQVLECKELEWITRHLEEGDFHSGEANVIRCTAIKNM